MTRDSQPKAIRLRPIAMIAGLVLMVFVLPVCFQLASHFATRDGEVSWRDLRRDSSEQAPDPASTSQAIIQVYAARAVRWRGAVGVHTWIATKPTDGQHYDRLEVMGFALRWGGGSVRVRPGQPDSYWYGSKPTLLRELRGGAEVDRLIKRLHQAAASYTYNHEYKIWPGPNSNTFIAHLARQVPELALELPSTAIGKDYLPNGGLVSRPPSGSGVQISLNGLFGLIIAPEEGLELNLLGLTAGIDLSPPAIKLPGVGRIGFPDFQHRTL